MNINNALTCLAFYPRKILLKIVKRGHFEAGQRSIVSGSSSIRITGNNSAIRFGSHVSIGCFTRIECTGSFAHLGEGFVCGNHCGLGTNAFYGAAGGITLGDNVIVGNYVSFHSENHIFSDTTTPIRLQGTSHKGIFIGDDCWIGAKATILDGVHLGKGCVVAAGAVVTKSFPDNVVIGGIPAEVLKKRL